MKKKPVKTWSTPVKAEKKILVPCKLCGGIVFRPSLSCEGFSYVRCASCGLVQMNPQPLHEEIYKRYNTEQDAGETHDLHSIPSGSGEDYLAYELRNEEAFLDLQLLALEDAGFAKLEKEIFSRIQSRVQRNDWNSTESQPYAKPKVLDIGCATGSLLERLRNRGWDTKGVEISLPQAEYGKRIRNLDLSSLVLEENHFPDGYFDAVLASHLIEHLNDPARMVREVRRILVSEGRFFVTTPNIAGFQARLFGNRWRSAIFDHLYLFSLGTLSRMLVENDFILEKTATWGGIAAGAAPPPVKRVLDKAAKKFGFGDVMIIRAKKREDTGEWQ